MNLVVPLERFTRPRSKSGEPSGLASVDASRRRLLVRGKGVAQQPDVDLQTDWEIHSGRYRHGGAPWGVEPPAVIRGEHLVVIAGRRGERARGHHGHAGMAQHDDAVHRRLAFEAVEPFASETAHVIGNVDLRHAPRLSDAQHLENPLAAPHDQPPTEPSQRLMQIQERITKERPSIDPDGRPLCEGIVDDEERHHALGGGATLTQ